MESIKEQIYERVEKMYHQRVGISRMQERLSKTLNQAVPLELIRDIIKEVKEWKEQINEISSMVKDISWFDEPDSKKKEKQDWWLNDIVKWIWEHKDYDYVPETDHIIFYPDWKPYPVLRSTVQAMFEKYSKSWENYSWKQMQYEFELSPKAWNYIKWVMDLYKDSTPFDKVTLSQFGSKEDMEQAAKEKAERLTEGKMKRIYADTESRVKEISYKKFAKASMWYDMLMDKLEKVIKTYEPRDFWNYEVPKVSNNSTKDVFITDAHFWKKWTDWIVVRFKKLTRDLLETEEKNINITFGWDLWECFLPYGEMHVGQRLWTENINTEELIMLVVDVFEQMLLALHKWWKKIIFNGMWWNHDRFSEKKEFDPYRTPAMLVYRFLQKIVENTNIKINVLRNDVNIIKSWNIKYVFNHWDWLTPAKLNRIAMEQIEDNCYLCIVSWDKHHFRMTEISDRVLRIQSPAMAGNGKYDESLVLSSLPWAIFFDKNKDWLVDFIVKRYK